MTYQWPIDPQDLFAERYSQMLGSGLPVEDVAGVRTAVVEMWGDRPGGWVHEWSLLASSYAAAGRHDLAALAYGWAKFPVLADEAKHTAFKQQIDQYLLAASGFPVGFERRMLALDYLSGRTSLPVHMLSAPTLSPSAPVLIASGGVYTWKMDLHLLFAALALSTGAHVLAFDIPGTGEADVPLSHESTAVIDGLIGAARALGNGRVAHFGLSMGGYFSAYSGLAGIVDAAVVLGGPVEAAFAPDRKWEFGMADIVGNAAGLDRQPTDGELAALMAHLSLRPLLDEHANAPMLVINGADDVHVPQDDTLVFQHRPNTEVHLVPDSGHCAISKLAEVLPTISAWITNQLALSSTDGS